MSSSLGIPWKMYLSRGLSAWGDRMWAFACGLFLMELDKSDSLRLVAIYGFITCLSVLLLGAALGRWIDQKPRLAAATASLAVQNGAVAVACIILAVYFWKDFEDDWDDWVFYLISTVVILVATIANVAAVGSKIVVERDWIVVIADRDTNRLASINSVFRTIDLTCMILAPLLAGILFDFISFSATAGFVAAWNLVSVCAEYWLLVQIYRQFPGLAEKKQHEDAAKDTSIGKRLRNSAKSWQLYWSHSVRNAGISLSCLYLTVLGFDNVTYGYLLEQCVRESILGSLVGISAAVGVVGSVSFPFIRKKVNITRTGALGFLALVTTLAACVVSIWLPGSPFKYYSDNRSLGRNATTTTRDCAAEESGEYEMASVYSLIAGIVAARFGLWLVDLSVTQILQESVEETSRGAIGGVQSGINSFMDTIKFVLVIILPEQDTFGWLILVSYASICSGMLSYLSFAVKYWRTPLQALETKETRTPSIYSIPVSETADSPGNKRPRED